MVVTTDPPQLPDHGKHWRWIGGQTPALCQLCVNRGIATPASATFGVKRSWREDDVVKVEVDDRFPNSMPMCWDHVEWYEKGKAGG